MTEKDLLASLRANPFLLAPMAGITDLPFRSLMRELGCGVVVTELVSATGLKYSPQKTTRLMQFESTQHPVGIQLFGERLEDLADAAKVVEQMGADFVDLNFGCPVPKVVNKGAGSACLKDLNKLEQVIRATKSGISIPVTIKVRTGWDQSTRNTLEVVKVAADAGVTWVAIHGRTRAQGYSGAADWDYIGDVKAASPLPIIGNGDLNTASLARTRLLESQCDAVMIGRGCLKNPRIFLEARQIQSTLSLSNVLRRLHFHLEKFYDQRLILLQMKKFAAWYSSGFEGAAQFRKDVFKNEEPSATLKIIYEYFDHQSETVPLDTSHEPFLMGGHG